MIPFNLIGETRNAIMLGVVAAAIAGAGGLYIKGRFDGAHKERGKWEEAQNKKRLEQAAERRKAQREINKIASEHAQAEEEARDNLEAARQEVQEAQADFEAQTSIMDDQLFELQKIIIALQEKEVDPKIIERVKTIRINNHSPANDALRERLRKSLNSIR